MDYRGHRLYWHSGNGHGMPVYMAYLPDEQLGVVVLLNTWTAPFLHGELANRIFDHHLGIAAPTAGSESRASSPSSPEPEEPRVKGTKPSVALERYAGVYHHPLYGPIRVTFEDHRLFWVVNKGQRAELVHWHFDTFEVRWDDPVLRAHQGTFATFSLDQLGEPARLRSTFYRHEFEAQRK
jgi:hypothetical protein